MEVDSGGGFNVTWDVTDFYFGLLYVDVERDGGEPGTNIRVGFLFRSDRDLTFIDRPGADATTATSLTLGDNGVEKSYSPGRIDPLNSTFLNSRNPSHQDNTGKCSDLFYYA